MLLGMIHKYLGTLTGQHLVIDSMRSATSSLMSAPWLQTSVTPSCSATAVHGSSTNSKTTVATGSVLCVVAVLIGRSTRSEHTSKTAMPHSQTPRPGCWTREAVWWRMPSPQPTVHFVMNGRKISERTWKSKSRREALLLALVFSENVQFRPRSSTWSETSSGDIWLHIWSNSLCLPSHESPRMVTTSLIRTSPSCSTRKQPQVSQISGPR